KYLRQAVSITGLDTSAFARAVSAAQEIYGKFDWQFTDGTMMLWATSDVNQGQAECLDIANHYFTLKQSTQGLSSIAFQKEVDPHGVLANMAVGDAVHSYIHMDDNEVQYFTRLKGVSGERKFNPQLFHVSNIIQVQLSFVVIPVRGNNYKMLVVLHSMVLLDGTFSKVDTLNLTWPKEAH
ncbi:hypothetical protein L208DRAFT_1280606, partial [Tricholoma matsutake]